MTDKTYDVILSRLTQEALIIATYSNTKMYEKNTKVAQGLTLDEARALRALINAGTNYD